MGVHVNGIRSEHVSEVKYLGCVFDESGTDDTDCGKKAEVLLGHWLMLWVCSLSALGFCMKHCLCVF